MTPRRVFLVLSVVFLAALHSGCASWTPAWDQATAARPETPVSNALLRQARYMTAAVEDRDTLQSALQAYERVLGDDPAHYEALTTLADLSILQAASYTTQRRSKRALYRRAMRYAERAMYTNPSFRALADAGATPWEAVVALEHREIESIVMWMTALLYEFKEVMRMPARIVNIGRISDLRPLLERLQTLDPRWQAGIVPFYWGFYYFILPGSLGGDREESARRFAESVRLGPDRLLNSWGRAKYFHVQMKDRQAFRQDLEWVIAQDPAKMGDTQHWKHFIQRDARESLRDIDEVF